MSIAQQGDELIYAQLLRELATAIHAYLRARFGDLSLLDDCVQESLLAIHQARHTYDATRPFRPWLFTIVKHKTIDTLKKQRTLTVAESQGCSDPTGDGDAADEAGELLAILPADHREAVLMTKYWGFSVRESATRLGVSESVVKVRVHRGLRKIRLMLEAEVL